MSCLKGCQPSRQAIRWSWSVDSRPAASAISIPYRLLAKDAGPAPTASATRVQTYCSVNGQATGAKEGKGSIRKMKKLGKKSDGVLDDALLPRRYDSLGEWCYASFTTVSLRR